MSLQISATFVNASGQPEVTAGQPNSMTLTISNDGSPVTIAPGTPSYPPATGEFEIIVYFSQLYLSASEQQNLQIQGAGFAAQYFGGQYPGWVLAATQQTTWSGNLVFNVTGLTPDVSTGTYYLSLIVANANGSDNTSYSLPVMVQQAPAGAPQPLPLSISFQPSGSTGGTPNQVIITKIPSETVENTLILELDNTSLQPLVSQAWGSSQPRFTLSFVVAGAPPGYYALTSPDLLASVVVTPLNGALWTVTAQPGTPTTWVLAPTASNQQILGTGTQAIAQFQITTLATQFVPGPTMAYLQYTGIPGYSDGVVACALQKIYNRMIIRSFQISQDYPFDMPANGYATGYLSWEVDSSVLVQLECQPPVAPLPGSGAVPAVATAGYGQVASKEASYPVVVQQNQVFVLTGYDTILGNIVSASVAAEASPSLENRWVSTGVILPWQGALADKPSGYAICDGTNGTPDLTDCFILGASGSQAPGPMPANSNTHTHPLSGFNGGTPTTSSNGSHTHGMPSNWYARGYTSVGLVGKGFTNIDTDGTFSTSTQTQSAGGHTHTVTVSISGLNTQVNSGGLRPPWFALYYIMKTATD